MLAMKWRIWLQKIMMIIRIKNKDDKTLCGQIYHEEKRMGSPGLAMEVAKICQEIGIPKC